MAQKHIIAIHAPSWAWKSEVMNHIRSVFPQIWQVPNATTRPKRWSNDNDYHFTTKAEFLKMRKHKQILQSAKVETKWVKEYYWMMEPPEDISIIALEETWLKTVEEVCKKYNILFTKIYLEVPEPIRIQRMYARWDSTENIASRANFDRVHFTKKWIWMCDYIIDASKSLEAVCKDIEELISKII